MSRIEPVQVNGSILVELDETDPGNPIVLYQAGAGATAQTLKAEPEYVSLVGLLSNLRCRYSVPSLVPAQLPDLALTASDTQRLTAALDLQWVSARIHLACLLSLDGGINWSKVGEVSLLNTGYPYASSNLLDLFTDSTALEVADGVAIGVQLLDVGFGRLNTGDSVTIAGAWVEEIYLREALSSVSVSTPDTAVVETKLDQLIAGQGTAASERATIASNQSVILAEIADVQSTLDNLTITIDGGVVP